MVSDNPAPPERTRHLTHIHRTHCHQDPYPAAAYKPSYLKHRQRRRTALEGTSDDTQKRAELDVSLATEGIAGPHHEERTHGAAGTEEAVGGGDGGGGAASVARLILLRKIEVEIPAWLADC